MKLMKLVEFPYISGKHSVLFYKSILIELRSRMCQGIVSANKNEHVFVRSWQIILGDNGKATCHQRNIVMAYTAHSKIN